MTVYFPDEHSPEKWEEMAHECYRRVEESWERSDTDGYMSQWAAQVSAQFYRECAEVARNGNKWTFRVLADAEGNEIPDAREVKTKFGYSWLIPGRGWFNPSQDKDEEKRKAKNLAKGYQFIEVEREAVVISVEGGLWRSQPMIVPKRERES